MTIHISKRLVLIAVAAAILFYVGFFVIGHGPASVQRLPSHPAPTAR